MKVAFLLGSLNLGGTETLLLDIFNNAEKSNLDGIGIYRKSGVLEKDFQNSGLPMHKVPTGNLIRHILSLRKLLTENGIQIAHAQQPIDAFFARLACLGTPIKVILTIHGYDFKESKLWKWITGIIIKQTDRNIFVSDTQRKYYQQKYHLKPDKQQVVYNGISFAKMEMHNTGGSTLSRNPCNQAIPLRDELQLSSKTLLLGTVGNFVPGRDPLTLCRFLNLLYQQNLDFHFLFVGKRADKSPQLYDNCISYCAQHKLLDRVSFLGSRNDVPAILPQLDAFLYATDHDTFGIAVVEAIATGIPVFVNDWDVLTEITGNGKYATLYKTKDEDDLLREFMLFLQNKALYQAKAKEASMIVRKRYSIENHIEELKKVYKRLGNSD